MYRNHLRRSAFTLVELLVVTAVIAILAALLVGAAIAVFSKGPAVANRNDILQLSEALQQFYAKYKFYPPSHIKLCKNWANYGTTPLDATSMSYLGTMWPNLDRTQTFNWGGATPLPDTGVVLHGDQCLVFFLGGMPRGPGLPPQGFFNNPANPTVAAGTSTDAVKWFDFDGNRCVNLHTDGIFPSYLDSHAANNDGSTRNKMPFLYFSSGKRPDAYTTKSNSFVAVPGFIMAPFSVTPYVQIPGPPTKFYNSTTFQLISAGPDGVFGPGGPWSPGVVLNPGAADDISNFYDRNLGV